MTSCPTCPVASECHYPLKPTTCVQRRKFWSAEQRAEYDRNYPPVPIDRGEFAAACAAGNEAFGAGGTFGGVPE